MENCLESKLFSKIGAGGVCVNPTTQYLSFRPMASNVEPLPVSESWVSTKAQGRNLAKFPPA